MKTIAQPRERGKEREREHERVGEGDKELLTNLVKVGPEFSKCCQFLHSLHHLLLQLFNANTDRERKKHTTKRESKRDKREILSMKKGSKVESTAIMESEDNKSHA